MSQRPKSYRFVYPARFRKQRGGPVLVSFPDLPEALTEGDDLADAQEQAADCLGEAIAGRIVRGEDFPPPRAAARGMAPVVVPPVIAAKAALYLAVREAGISRVALARRLGIQEKDVRRMLDPTAPTKFPRLLEALSALDKRVVLEMQGTA